MLPPTRAERAAVAGIVVANFLLNRAVPRRLEIAASLGAAGFLVFLASRAGASLNEQGLSLKAARTGVRTGLAIGLPLGSVLGLGALLPSTARFYRDRRIVAADGPEAAYHLFARIPLATAAGEEIIFRSAFESVLALRRPRWQARLVSACLFGVWHVLPARDRMHSNPGVVDVHAGSVAGQAGVVLATFATTTVAGLGFSWLRDRTRSVLAPIIVHAAVNVGGYAGGWLAARARGRKCSEQGLS
jgi:membrane protease YdiL (CAAX protease family)